MKAYGMFVNVPCGCQEALLSCRTLWSSLELSCPHLSGFPRQKASKENVIHIHIEHGRTACFCATIIFKEYFTSHKYLFAALCFYYRSINIAALMAIQHKQFKNTIQLWPYVSAEIVSRSCLSCVSTSDLNAPHLQMSSNNTTRSRLTIKYKRVLWGFASKKGSAPLS